MIRVNLAAPCLNPPDWPVPEHAFYATWNHLIVVRTWSKAIRHAPDPFHTGALFLRRVTEWTPVSN